MIIFSEVWCHLAKTDFNQYLWPITRAWLAVITLKIAPSFSVWGVCAADSDLTYTCQPTECVWINTRLQGGVSVESEISPPKWPPGGSDDSIMEEGRGRGDGRVKDKREAAQVLSERERNITPCLGVCLKEKRSDHILAGILKSNRGSKDRIQRWHSVQSTPPTIVTAHNYIWLLCCIQRSCERSEIITEPALLSMTGTDGGCTGHNMTVHRT